jgi:6,7-dimethyl-8-ribityllumazine synthase
VEVVRVPGAFETPVAAAALARRKTERPDAVIILGLIWKGETTHADQIGGAVTDALMRLSIETGIPMVHEVITVATAEQARARCLDPKTNRGVEAARTALSIAATLRKLDR